MSARTVLRVDVHIELICPWCQIGLRHLQRARAEFARLHPDAGLELHWQLHTLLPDLPESGLPFREFYLRRLGSAAAVAARQAQVRAAGSAVGLRFEFDTIARMPNTGLAHALLRDAQAQLAPEALERLIERLFAAHFQLGENLGDAALLDALAADFGVRCSADTPLPEAPMAVPGVPYFVLAQAYALSGAQSHEHLLALMRQALQAQPALV